MMDETLATITHLRRMRAMNSRQNLCVPGARKIAQSLGLDWDRFIRVGLTVAELRATGNAFCIELADEALKDVA